jgi:chromatin remodeling complex protein RSC6
MSTQPQSPTSSKIDISLTDDDIIHLDERCYQNIPTIVREQPVDRRPPSGFTRPQLISDEMADFLGVEHGTEMARTAVSRGIHCYVEKHNLKQEGNGRYFRADAKLAKLLNYHYKGDDEKLKLGYFNLQKYMKHHFIARV